MTAGFDIKPGEHPIVPVMLYDAPLAQEFAAKLLEEGIYVIGFFFPVVPKGEARIRVQLSAAHERHSPGPRRGSIRKGRPGTRNNLNLQMSTRGQLQG